MKRSAQRQLFVLFSIGTLLVSACNAFALSETTAELGNIRLKGRNSNPELVDTYVNLLKWNKEVDEHGELILSCDDCERGQFSTNSHLSDLGLEGTVSGDPRVINVDSVEAFLESQGFKSNCEVKQASFKCAVSGRSGIVNK